MAAGNIFANKASVTWSVCPTTLDCITSYKQLGARFEYFQVKTHFQTASEPHDLNTYAHMKVILQVFGCYQIVEVFFLYFKPFCFLIIIACHRACSGCSSYGSHRCTECASGFRLENNICKGELLVPLLTLFQSITTFVI